ncbi:MAG: tRNA modification GTPase TrmE [Chthonomonadales bacterium]|nr:tRNA modification GTPase TrmE [Chthonomonadales bacterium]
MSAHTIDTIAAVATPPGEGGIAVIRVSGPLALSIADRVFGRDFRGDLAGKLRGYTVRYGQFVDMMTGDVADDGLLTVFRAPHSYTGEDCAELSCHGGRATTERVLRLTLDAGARLAGPGEFTQRAFLNGKLDLAQAEAVADVIRARTETARRQARRQLEGALSSVIGQMRDELIGILAAIEVTIDFSEEVGELEYGPLEERIAAVHLQVRKLLATVSQGRVLREGLAVALVGRPNVGKSSLLNALLRADRAIVTPIAGTTRDTLEETATLGGLAVVLTDTAGIRDTGDVVERLGVQRAQNAAARADVALVVLDAVDGITEADEAVVAPLMVLEAAPLLVALNKCDLLADEKVAALRARVLTTFALDARQVVPVSAQTGEGLEALEAALVRPYLASESDAAESVIVTAARHAGALEAANLALDHALETTRACLPGDFIAIDVRGALDALGEITGETVTDEIVHRIFQDFCVGK